jgi:chromosome segregation ATPase
VVAARGVIEDRSMLTDAGGDPAPKKKRRNIWIWISGGLAIIAAGLLVWALSTRSDLTDSQQQVDDLHAQIDQSAKTGGTFLAAAKTVIQDLTAQLGATSEDLDSAQQQIDDAQQTAEQAQKDADAAEQAAQKAGNATEKAEAQAEQAKAQAKEAESKAAVAGDCAKAYTSAIGTLLEGDDVRAQAAQVAEQLRGITSDCKAALEGA